MKQFSSFRLKVSNSCFFLHMSLAHRNGAFGPGKVQTTYATHFPKGPAMRVISWWLKHWKRDYRTGERTHYCPSIVNLPIGPFMAAMAFSAPNPALPTGKNEIFNLGVSIPALGFIFRAVSTSWFCILVSHGIKKRTPSWPCWKS